MDKKEAIKRVKKVIGRHTFQDGMIDMYSNDLILDIEDAINKNKYVGSMGSRRLE